MGNARSEDVEAKYMQVQSIYSTSFPRSRCFIPFLTAFGRFYERRNQYERAEEKYLAGIYEKTQRENEASKLYLKNPISLPMNFLRKWMRYHLKRLALSYEAIGRFDAAMEIMRKASQLCQLSPILPVSAQRIIECTLILHF